MNKKVIFSALALFCLLPILAACNTRGSITYFDSPEAFLSQRGEDRPLVDESWVGKHYLVRSYLEMEYTFQILPEDWETLSDQELAAQTETETGPSFGYYIFEQHADGRYSLLTSGSSSFPRHISAAGEERLGSSMVSFGTAEVGPDNHSFNFLIVDTNFEDEESTLFDLSKLKEVLPGVYFALEFDTDIHQMQQRYYADHVFYNDESMTEVGP